MTGARHGQLLVGVLASAVCLTATVGCRQDMHDQPKYEALEASAFFADGRSARQPVAGTVARGQLREESVLYTGTAGEGQGPVTTFPFPVTRGVLQRGQERYDIFCSPCHDRVGTGRGMIVRRGYRKPPSFHDDRLRSIPVGYFFNVISQGFGTMPSYASQVPPRDRWAIAAYIRALQLSQRARLAELPADQQRHLANLEEEPFSVDE